MKQQKVMAVIIIVLLVAIICIQLFTKQKIKLTGNEGESGVLLKNAPATVPATEPLIEE